MQSWKQCALITTMALWQLKHLGTWCTVYISGHKWTVHHVPKGMSCRKVIMVIIGRPHCFHDCIYILCPSCFCQIWALCVSQITYDHLCICIYIHIYIIYIIYIFTFYTYINTMCACARVFKKGSVLYLFYPPTFWLQLKPFYYCTINQYYYITT